MMDLTGVLHLKGCALRYADDGGNGAPVLLLHGAGADHVMFSAQWEALATAGFRPVVLDLRGHGVSRPTAVSLSADRFTEDVEALITHLGLHQPALVGHSLGGNLAQRLVQRAPYRYSALAVIDSAWNSGPLTAVERFSLRATAPLLGLVPARRLPRLMADASAVTGAARTDLVRAFSNLSRSEFLAVWQATTEFVVPEPGYRTPIPLLLMRGEKDRTGNIAAAMPLWADAEGVRELVVPGAGHVVTQDAPQAVSDALLAFL
jgi:3-oxoadipate enol-lactonase